MSTCLAEKGAALESARDELADAQTLVTSLMADLAAAEGRFVAVSEFAQEELAAAEQKLCEEQERAEKQLLHLRAELESPELPAPPKPRDMQHIQTLSAARQSQVRREAVLFLYEVFTLRQWEVRDLAEALAGADRCEALFETKPFHNLRMRWLMEIWDTIHQRWNNDKLIGLMLDAGLSHRQIDKMRQAFSLTYETEADRYYHNVFLHLELADRRLYVRDLEPVPPRVNWATRFREVKKDLKIEMNPDGTISSLRLTDVVPEMLQQHRALEMMHLDVGVTNGKAKVVMMFDGFPVDDMYFDCSFLCVQRLFETRSLYSVGVVA